MSEDKKDSGEKSKRVKKKGDKQAKENIIVSKVKSFSTNIASEFKRIVWPKKEELAKQTLIVIVICAIFGFVIFGMDAGFAAVLRVFAGFI